MHGIWHTLCNAALSESLCIIVCVCDEWHISHWSDRQNVSCILSHADQTHSNTIRSYVHIIREKSHGHASYFTLQIRIPSWSFNCTCFWSILMTCVASHGLEIEKRLFYHFFIIVASSKVWTAQGCHVQVLWTPQPPTGSLSLSSPICVIVNIATKTYSG